MDQPKPHVLNYTAIDPDRRGKALRWLAFRLMLVQILWFIPVGLWQLLVLTDGRAKSPAKDLLRYVVVFAPSIPAALISIWDCFSQYRSNHSLRNCKRSIVVLIVSIIFLALMLLGWINDDVIHRNIQPHGWGGIGGGFM
jgi:hypothetical protein